MSSPDKKIDKILFDLKIVDTIVVQLQNQFQDLPELRMQRVMLKEIISNVHNL